MSVIGKISQDQKVEKKLKKMIPPPWHWTFQDLRAAMLSIVLLPANPTIPYLAPEGSYEYFCQFFLGDETVTDEKYKAFFFIDEQFLAAPRIQTPSRFIRGQ